MVHLHDVVKQSDHQMINTHEPIRPGLGHSHSNVGGQPPIGGRGAQLYVDTTLVSTLHGDGRPRKGAVDRDGGTPCCQEVERTP